MTKVVKILLVLVFLATAVVNGVLPEKLPGE